MKPKIGERWLWNSASDQAVLEVVKKDYKDSYIFLLPNQDAPQ